MGGDYTVNHATAKSSDFKESMMDKLHGYLWRTALSVVAFFIHGWVNAIITPVAALGSGIMSGKELEPSNLAYIESVAGVHFFAGTQISMVVLLAILAAIWWKPLMKVFTPPTVTIHGLPSSLIAIPDKLMGTLATMFGKPAEGK